MCLLWMAVGCLPVGSITAASQCAVSGSHFYRPNGNRTRDTGNLSPLCQLSYRAMEFLDALPPEAESLSGILVTAAVRAFLKIE